METGGKQYRVQEGDVLRVEKEPASFLKLSVKGETVRLLFLNIKPRKITGAKRGTGSHLPRWR